MYMYVSLMTLSESPKVHLEFWMNMNYQTEADTNLIDIVNLHGENIYNCNGFVSTVLANNIIIDTKLTRAGS